MPAPVDYEFTISQLDSARQAEKLRVYIAGLISSSALLDKPASSLSPSERDELDDAVVEAFLNLDLTVDVFTGYGAYGEFPITVIGVPGAYRVSAPEFDRSPCFDTLDEASDWLELEYGPYLERPEA